MALYEPGFGYYVSGKEKFSERGDFITAPVLGDIFGICLARQCEQIFDHTGMRNMLEFGAGNGELAATVLRSLEKLERLPERYFILEPGAELRQRQAEIIQEKAGPAANRVVWLSEMPEEFSGVVLANEVLDAMPCQRFRIDDTGVARRCDVIESGGLLNPVFSHSALSDQFCERISAFDLPEGYESECNPVAEAWTSSLATSLKEAVVLLIDYGFPDREYYHPDRSQGTLMCHYRHIAHSDPMFYPGLQDITAHVDFTAIGNSASTAGLDVCGYTTQAGFLLGCGALEHLQTRQLEAGSDREYLEMSQEMKKLVLPHEMGELFKVLSLSRNIELDLIGFQIQNRMGKL